MLALLFLVSPAAHPRQWKHFGPLAGGCPPAAIPLEVGSSWQTVISSAPEGAVFCVRSGIHRGQTVAPKSHQQFLAEPGAVMSGAVELGGFTRSGRYWSAPGPVQPRQLRGACLREHPGCNDPMTLFIGGKPLEQVPQLDKVDTGTFYVRRTTGTFYFVDNPVGRMVEVTLAAFAFTTNHANNVVVRGLIVEKYGNPAQLGAIYADADAAASDWLIENNEVRLNSGAGILAGHGAIIRGNNVHHNGQQGVHSIGNSVLFENNEIAFNNTRGFDHGWDAGGLKAVLGDNIIFRGNWVHHNNGPGLWCDVRCRHVTYEDNMVEDNSDAGIFHEISYDAVIKHNTVRRNGQGGLGSIGHLWFWGAEILIAGSQNVEIVHNTVVVGPNGNGIVLIDQGREEPDHKISYKTAHNYVHDNDIWPDGPSSQSGGISDVPPGHPNYTIIEAGGNLFDGNRYHVPAAGCDLGFGWGHKRYDFAGFRRQGQEQHGGLISGSAEP